MDGEVRGPGGMPRARWLLANLLGGLWAAALAYAVLVFVMWPGLLGLPIMWCLVPVAVVLAGLSAGAGIGGLQAWALRRAAVPALGSGWVRAWAIAGVVVWSIVLALNFWIFDLVTLYTTAPGYDWRDGIPSYLVVGLCMGALAGAVVGVAPYRALDDCGLRLAPWACAAVLGVRSRPWLPFPCSSRGWGRPATAPRRR